MEVLEQEGQLLEPMAMLGLAEEFEVVGAVPRWVGLEDSECL